MRTCLAAQFVIYGIILPCLAGLDGARQSLYLNLCVLLLLAFVAWLLLSHPEGEEQPQQMSTT